MENEFVHNNPQDPAEEIFERLEVQVIDINRSMNLLVLALASKLGPFGDDGGSNSENRSEGKSEDHEDSGKESWKESEKEQSILSVANPSRSIFKMEAKGDIKPYQGEIDASKLNYWLQQLEVYFSIHHIDDGKNISFSRLKLEGHALTRWENHMETLRLEGDLLVTRWEDFKTLIKAQFYPIGYVEYQWIRWHYFRQRQGQSVQEYTTEFRKMAIMMGISPKNSDVLLKYMGRLQSHLRKQVMLFNPRTMDEACVHDLDYFENEMKAEI
jgi:hypothetical protein